MKKPNDLNTIMPVLAEEEKTNEALIYDFQSAQTPDAPLSPYITVVNAPDSSQPLIGSLKTRFPSNPAKIQSIPKN